ncbi:MAG TPA: hypothetical protein VJ844_10550 [Mucilaginibacter sp.]|nr:hypothetical protein [Mucilaginibacter sp.]
MKKLVAIILLGAHLFMLGGYTLVFQYFIQRSDVEIVKQMYNNKESSANLIELKVPVNMPTIQDWAEYEHITGQIQLSDGYYNYVGIKMTRDTMSLLCLPNHVKDKLVKANLIIAKGLNDVPLSKKTAEPVTKKVIEVYKETYTALKANYVPLMNQIKPVSYTLTLHLDHPYIESPGKPPNTSC